MTSVRALLPLLVLPAALVAAPAQAAPAADGATGHTQVVANCTAYRQTPRKVIGACGDLGAVAIVRDWTSWTGHQARGTGTWVVNTCTPDCAAGHVRRFPATFSLHRVVDEDGVRVFSRLGITYVSGGEPKNLSVALPTAPIDD